MERSFDRMMWVQSNSFQIQMAHLESTPVCHGAHTGEEQEHADEDINSNDNI